MPRSGKSRIAYRQAGSHINVIGILQMVKCSYCEKRGLDCRMVSLEKRCGNCVFNNHKECVPADLPKVDYSKLNKTIAKLEAEEEETEEAEERALEMLRVARSRLRRLRKQKRLLKAREEETLRRNLETASELERLENLEDLTKDFEFVTRYAEAPVVPFLDIPEWGVGWPKPQLFSDAPFPPVTSSD